jgi:hypothetical protein
MTEAEFLYQYTKIYHLPIVGAVLMVENWTDRDFDVKYARYMQEYIAIKGEVYSADKPDDKIKASLALLRAKRLKSTYTALFDFVKSRLEQSKGVLSPEKMAGMEKRLEKYVSLDEINFDYMREIRRIEEEEY